MDPFTIMAIAGAVSAAAGVGGTMLANDAREDQANSANKWGLWMQREQSSFNAQMAETAYLRNIENWLRSQQSANASMAFGERMSNTAYQRGMADMRAAGLNPILAYAQGGATAPGGSMATPSAAPSASAGGFTPGAKADIADAISPGVTSAMNAVRLVQGVQSAQEEIKQTQANTALQQVQAGREAAVTGNILQQTATEAQRTGLVTRQAATEAAREGLVQAQTGAASAAAGLSAAQTRTESEREREVGFRADRERWQAGSAQQEYQRFQDWGPRSPVMDAGASAEAISNRIQRNMREGLGPFLRVNP